MKEHKNIFECLALAKEDENVEMNWASNTEWLTEKAFRKFTNSDDYEWFLRLPPPFYTRQKQSVVDEVVEKLESYERNSNKPPECVDLPFREILSDYRIEKKSKGVAMAGPKKKQSPRVELQNAIVSIFGVRNVEDMCKFDSLLSEYDITEKSSIVEPECEHEQHKDLCYPYSPTRPQPSKSVASGIDECASSIVDYFSEWDYEEEVKEILTKHWPQENK